MELYSTLASVFTVISFFVFVGIVCWAYSARRKPSFDAAAKEPFALPEEAHSIDARLHAGTTAAGSSRDRSHVPAGASK